MIRDSQLSYGPPTESWAPQNIISSALAVALLTTILSYQASSVLSTPLLGTIKRRIMSPAALHTLLLLRKASPLAVLSAVSRSDIFTRLYFHPALPASTRITREPRSVSMSVVTRLFFLLAAVPLINVASLIMTLESEKILTFSDANFGGAAFGLNDDLSVIDTEPITEGCTRAIVNYKRGDSPLSHFLLCSGIHHARDFWFTEGGIFITKSESDIKVHIQVGSKEVYASRGGYLFGNDTNNELRLKLRKEALDNVLDFGVELLAAECGTRTPSNNPIENRRFTLQTLIGNRTIECPDAEDGTAKALSILHKILPMFTIVDDDSLQLTKEGVHRDAGEVEFLRRRRKNVEFQTLWIATCVTVLLRVLVCIVWKDDLDMGIERLMKEELGYSCCESLLQAEPQIISFANKYQNGNIAEYGLEKVGLPEVERFDGGLVGTELSIQKMERDCWKDRD